MPELARFFGIIIRMHVEVGAQHHLPHFHAHYNDDEAVYTISKKHRITRLSGSMPEKQDRLILAWAEIHKTDLNNAWDRLSDGKWDKNLQIEPLR